MVQDRPELNLKLPFRTGHSGQGRGQGQGSPPATTCRPRAARSRRTKGIDQLQMPGRPPTPAPSSPRAAVPLLAYAAATHSAPARGGAREEPRGWGRGLGGRRGCPPPSWGRDLPAWRRPPRAGLRRVTAPFCLCRRGAEQETGCSQEKGSPGDEAVRPRSRH